MTFFVEYPPIANNARDGSVTEDIQYVLQHEIRSQRMSDALITLLQHLDLGCVRVLSLIHI